METGLELVETRFDWKRVPTATYISNSWQSYIDQTGLRDILQKYVQINKELL